MGSFYVTSHMYTCQILCVGLKYSKITQASLILNKCTPLQNKIATNNYTFDKIIVMGC
jgi:hypothetical protein